MIWFFPNFLQEPLNSRMLSTKNIHCECGKSFATVRAMEQHTAASRRHAQTRPQEASQPQDSRANITQEVNENIRDMPPMQAVSLTSAKNKEDEDLYAMRYTVNPGPSHPEQNAATKELMFEKQADSFCQSRSEFANQG
jgi:hypothetical protein